MLHHTMLYHSSWVVLTRESHVIFVDTYYDHSCPTIYNVLQRYLSIVDTIGTQLAVLYREVSPIQS